MAILFRGFNVHLGKKADLKTLQDIMEKVADSAGEETTFSNEEMNVAIEIRDAIGKKESFDVASDDVPAPGDSENNDQ